MTTERARRIAAVLFVVTAIAFAVGVSLEDSGESAEVGEGTEEVTGTEDHEENTEEGAEGHTEGGEEVLGVDLESPVLVGGAVAVSILLAGALAFTRLRSVAIAGMGFGVLFTVFDGAEIFHQLDESRTGLALLAAAIALGHLGAAGLCGWAARPDQ